MPNRQTFDQIFVPSVNGDMVLGFMQEAEGYVARKVCPIALVGKQSGKYPLITKENWRRNYVGKREPGQVYNRASWANTFEQYFTEESGLELPRPIEHGATADFDLSTLDAMFLADQLLISEELDFAEAFLGTGKWANDVSPSTLWDDSSATIISDIRGWLKTGKDACGRRLNTIVMDQCVHDAIVDSAEFLDRVKHTQLGIVGMDLLAAIFGIPAGNIHVMDSLWEDSQEGDTSNEVQTHGQSQGFFLMLHNTPGQVELNAPSAMKMFAWDTFDRGMQNIGVESYEEKPRKSVIHRVNNYVDFKLTMAQAGVFAHTLVAA